LVGVANLLFYLYIFCQRLLELNTWQLASQQKLTAPPFDKI